MILVILILGCDNTDSGPEAEGVVVEAFLFAGEPVDDIQLTQVLSFDSESTEPVYINDALVTLYRDDEMFGLIPAEGDSGFYHYPGDDLEIEIGETYSLEIEYLGEIVSAETTVPAPPAGVASSEEVLEIAPINQISDIGNIREIPQVEITWENPDADYYYVLVENIEENPSSINNSGFDFGGRANFFEVSEPVQEDFHIIQPNVLPQYGTYRVQVFRVNLEYADLFETFEQDSRSLSEPLSNVNNGIGIFTAFSSDQLTFEVVRP